MASAAGMSWTDLDEQIRAGRASSAHASTLSVAAPVKPSVAAETTSPEQRSRALLADWTRVLDAINEAGTQAQNREKRLAAQALAHDRQVSELRAEISKLQEQTRVSEVRTQALLSAAEDRTRAAEGRAEHAEEWLARIGAAVNTLLLKA